jgi:hypothetical protein
MGFIINTRFVLKSRKSYDRKYRKVQFSSICLRRWPQMKPDFFSHSDSNLDRFKISPYTWEQKFNNITIDAGNNPVGISRSFSFICFTAWQATAPPFANQQTHQKVYVDNISCCKYIQPRALFWYLCCCCSSYCILQVNQNISCW